MHRTKSSVILYSILGSGVALAFLGHGVLGAKAEPKFIDLVTGNYDKVLGGTMSHSTAVGFVNAIGYIDIALAIVFAGLVIGAIAGKGFAFSAPVMYLFGWAAIWGFLTALSRFTAVMNGKEVWDVIERGPNYLLPAGLVYLVYRIRKAERAETRAEPILEMPTNGEISTPDRVLAGTR
jgi:hypothetical protein